MRKHQLLYTQQTGLGTLIWHGATLVCLLFPLSQPFQPQLSLLNTVICHCPTCLVYCKTFLHDLSSKAEFPQRREECRIRDGILVITAIEFLADLRQDLNAPCLHSLWGGAGNLKDSPFYLIPCQKQSLWGAGPCGHLAQSCYFILFYFIFSFYFFKQRHSQVFWFVQNLTSATDNTTVLGFC